MSGGCIPRQLFDTDAMRTMWLESNRHIITYVDRFQTRAEDSHHPG